MPAISYSKTNIEKYDFANKIIKGIKIHTIRRYGPGLIKRPFKLGDILYHYKNWRTPQVKKICENKCLYIADIKIHRPELLKIEINNKNYPHALWYILSKNDGFENQHYFLGFFIKAGLPFYGQIIGWKEGISYE